MPDNATMTATQPKKLSVLALASVVVGSMVGAGVFSLPGNFGQATGVLGAIVAWAIAGGGTLMLVFVFQSLATRKPALDAGIFAYAKAGFGNYIGFFSAFGYWASACAGNVTYWVLIGSTLGAVFPAFGEGNSLVWIAIASVGLWLFHLLVTRGVREAAIVNAIVTVAKLAPLVTFIAIAATVGFNWEVFTGNLWGAGTADFGTISSQVQSTMLVTVFVFLGVEGASVYSRHARTRKDVGRATLLGFVGVLALFVLVSLLSYGVVPQDELAGMRQPSVAGVLESVVGPWGLWFISAGLIISVLGAYLAWTLMSAEVMYAASQSADAPKFLSRVNAKGVPTASLLLSSAFVQVLLVVVLFSDDAFSFALSLCSSMALIPYLLTAVYALKLESRGGDDPAGRSTLGLVVAVLATIYTVFLIIAGGISFLLVSFLIYAPGTILFVIARRERGRRVFTKPEAIACTVAVVLGALAVVGLAVGWVQI